MNRFQSLNLGKFGLNFVQKLKKILKKLSLKI